MTPYQDADLAALLLRRGLLGLPDLRRAAEARGEGGRLARALVTRGLLSDAQVKEVLRDLAGFVRSCPGCGQPHAALPGPAARRVACPACGAAELVPPDPRGVEPPPPGWEAVDAVGPPTQRLPEAERGPGSSKAAAATWFDAHAAQEGSSATRGPPRRAPGGGRPTSSGGTRADPAVHGKGPGSDAVARTRNDGSSHPPRGPASSGRARRREGSLPPGTAVGPYVVDEEVSRGSMGVVLRAHHAEMPDHRVALKLMMSDLEVDAESLERFRREGEALARLDHPHVVRVHQAGLTAEGRPYLALDFVEGRTLEQVLKAEGTLPLERAARLLEAVARGVAHMHERGIVHRDLKLANVLLDAQECPRVADFGLAHLADRRTRLTMAGDMLGTPLYMAPEAITGGGLEIDGRADVYSLGVMLWRLLTGAYPFRSEQPAQLFELVLTAPLRFPTDPPLAPDARAVLGRALARDREERYPDAGALAIDLAALAAGRPVAARDRTRPERVRAWLRARPRRVAAALVGLLLLLLVPLLLSRSAEQERRAHLAGMTRELLEARTRLASAPEPPDPPAYARLRTLLAGARARLLHEPRDEPAEALEEAAAALAPHLDQAEARLALRGLAAEGASRAALVAAREAFARADAASQGVAPTLPYRRDRAWIHLTCGDAAAALEALAPLEGRELAEDAGAASLLAWARLLVGGREAERAEDALAAGAPAERAALLLARAAVARATGGDALGRARALLSDLPVGGEAALGRLEADALERADDPPRLRELLPALVGLVREAGETPLGGRARLLRARLLLRMGHPATARFEAGRARELVGVGPTPLVAVEGRLLSPRLAAVWVEARAAAELPDGEQAQDAARALGAFGLDWPGVGEVARSLVAAAEQLARPGQVDVASPGQDDLAARRSLVRGELLLERTGELEQARRAFLLALGRTAEPGLVSRARIGAARAALGAGRAEETRRWLEGTVGWRSAAARAELSLATGDPATAGDAWLSALDALEAEETRPLQRAALGIALAGRAVDALAGRSPAMALALAERAILLANAERLSLPLRNGLYLRAQGLAVGLEGPAAAGRWKARIEADLGPEAERWNALIQRLAAIKRQAGPGQVSRDMFLAIQEQLRAGPTEVQGYVGYHTVVADPSNASEAELSNRSVDPLVMAFELDPLHGLYYFASQRGYLENPEQAAHTRTMLQGMIERTCQDPAMTSRDPGLRLAISTALALEAQLSLEPGGFERGLAGAWEHALARPNELAGVLMLGRLLLAAGDPAEAAQVLGQVAWARLPFRETGPGQRAWGWLWVGVAEAELGARGRAQTALERAVADAQDWRRELEEKGARLETLSTGWVDLLRDRMATEPALVELGLITIADRLGGARREPGKR